MPQTVVLLLPSYVAEKGRGYLPNRLYSGRGIARANYHVHQTAFVDPATNTYRYSATVNYDSAASCSFHSMHYIAESLTHPSSRLGFLIRASVRNCYGMFNIIIL